MISDATPALSTTDRPILLDLDLMLALDGATTELAADDSVGVVVLRSAQPGWFIAHADVNLILQLDPATSGPPAEGLSFFHVMVERLRTIPKLTISRGSSEP